MRVFFIQLTIQTISVKVMLKSEKCLVVTLKCIIFAVGKPDSEADAYHSLANNIYIQKKRHPKKWMTHNIKTKTKAILHLHYNINQKTLQERIHK